MSIRRKTLDFGVRACFHCDLAQMPMMREIDDLADLGHFAELAECFFNTVIVKTLHDVVGDERHWSADAGKFMIAGDPQRQIKLETRA